MPPARFTREGGYLFAWGEDMRLKLTARDQMRFWAKVKRGADNDCWEWTAGLDRKGYGRFWAGGKHIKAHRFSFALHNGGEIPEGANILHSCDNPPMRESATLVGGNACRQQRGHAGERARRESRRRTQRARATRLRPRSDDSRGAGRTGNPNAR